MSEEHDNRNREQELLRLLHAAARRERAPESLRAKVAGIRERAGARRRRRPALRRPVLGLSFGMPVVAAAIAGLVLALGSAGAPSLAQAAALSIRPPAAPAPAADPSDPSKLLTAKVGSLHFPNWGMAGGWRAVGQRFDHIGNRTARTVYYAAGSSWVVYSILSSPALSIKTGTVVLPSGRLRDQYATTLTRNGRTTVVWDESGHTCLLTGPRGMSAARLWQLAFYGFRQPLTSA